MDDSSQECDPNDFYTLKSDVLDKATDVARVMNYCTASFVLCFAPFIVIAPFFVDKLNVLTRKIIAMIVLSDSIKFICDTIVTRRKNLYENHWHQHRYECTSVAIVQGSAPIWSMAWYAFRQFFKFNTC